MLVFSCVLFKKSLLTSKSWRYFPTLYLCTVLILFLHLVHDLSQIDFHVWWEVDIKVPFLPFEYPIDPASMMEKTIPSLLNRHRAFVVNPVSIDVTPLCFLLPDRPSLPLSITWVFLTFKTPRYHRACDSFPVLNIRPAPYTVLFNVLGYCIMPVLLLQRSAVCLRPR